MTTGKEAFIDQLVTSGSNFVIIVLAARYLAAADVAKYAYSFGFNMLIYMIANAWIYQNIMSSGQQKLKEDITHYAGLILLLVLLSIPISALLFQLITSDSFIYGHWVEAGIAALFVAVNQLIDFERRIRYFVSHPPLSGPVIISMTGFFLRIIGLIIIQPDSFESFMIVIIIFSFPGLLLSLRRLSLSIFSKKMFVFSLHRINDGKWMTVNIPINWAWGQAPVYIVGVVFGLQAAGIFAAVRSIANLANVIMELLPTYIASRLSHFYTSGKVLEYQKYLRAATGLGCFLWALGLAVVFMYGEQILSLILGDKYASNATLLILFWIFNVCIFLSRIQFLNLRFIEKTNIIPMANLFGVAALCTSFALWFKDGGIEGMAWAMIIGGSFIVIIQLFGASGHNKYKGKCNAG